MLLGVVFWYLYQNSELGVDPATRFILTELLLAISIFVTDLVTSSEILKVFLPENLT